MDTLHHSTATFGNIYPTMPLPPPASALMKPLSSRRYNLGYHQSFNNHMKPSYNYGISSGGDAHQYQSSPYSSRILNSRNVYGEFLMANTVGYPSSSTLKMPRRHEKNISSYSSSHSYLQGYDAAYPKYPRTRTSSSYGSYENFSLASSLPDQYGQSYLDQDYKIKQLPQDYRLPSQNSRRHFSSRGFDPRASYISDMESREFGSHVDMIQSLQLRSSVVDVGSDLFNTHRGYNTNSSFLKPHPLQSSSSSIMYDIGSNRNYSSIFSTDPLLNRDTHYATKQSSITPVTPSSARVSFLSPCVDRSFPLTEQFSSYTSSPTSPFSEPFPDPLKTYTIDDDRPSSRPRSKNRTPISHYAPAPAPSTSFPMNGTSYDDLMPQLPQSSKMFSSLNQPPYENTTAFEKSYFANDKIPKYSSMSFNREHMDIITPNVQMPKRSKAPQIRPSPSNVTKGLKSNVKDDETLNLLKKYYLEALVAQNTNSDKSLPSSLDSIKNPTAQRSFDDIVDYKKLYEDCSRENKLLSEDITGVKLQLEKVKHQLDLAAQASLLNPGSEYSIGEKENIDRKLTDIRNELKLYTISGTVTSQQLDKLGKEIENLKFENKSLFKNVSEIRHPESYKRDESGRGHHSS